MSYLQEKSVKQLKVIAEEFGLEFAGNISKEKLIAKIEADDAAVEGTPVVVEGVKVAKKETPAALKKRMNILKRVRISANDPQYKGRNGVTLQVGNKVAVVGKFTPFDIVWHIQVPVYEALKRKQWRETKFKTDPATGNKFPVVTMRPAFVIEVLEPLTSKELDKLAAEQAARGSIPNDDN